MKLTGFSSLITILFFYVYGGNPQIPIRFAQPGKFISLIGTFKISNQIPQDSCFYICYNGEIIKIKENETSFLIKDYLNDQINILFTDAKNVNFCSEENTVLWLKLSSKKNYKFYQLFKVLKDPKNIMWEIHEIPLNEIDNKIEIPLNTLIVPLNPDKVKIKLENSCWKRESSLIKLPIIEISGSNLNDQFLKSCLIFMNFKPIHNKQEKRKKVIHHGNTRICLIMDE